MKRKKLFITHQQANRDSASRMMSEKWWTLGAQSKSALTTLRAKSMTWN